MSMSRGVALNGQAEKPRRWVLESHLWNRTAAIRVTDGAGSVVVRAQLALAVSGRGQSCSKPHVLTRTPDARELRHIALRCLYPCACRRAASGVAQLVLLWFRPVKAVLGLKRRQHYGCTVHCRARVLAWFSADMSPAAVQTW